MYRGESLFELDPSYQVSAVVDTVYLDVDHLVEASQVFVCFL